MRDFHVDAGGYRVAVRDWGGDGPAIVLLHGGGANLADWDVVAPLLAHEFRVAAYDLHGHGLTETPPERALDVGVPLRELDAVRRALEMDGPLLVGSSLGGGISLRYASTGGSCAGVVAIDGAPLWYSGEQVRPPADPDATREQYESEGLGSIRTEAATLSGASTGSSSSRRSQCRCSS